MTGTRQARPRPGRPPLADRASIVAAARELGFAELTIGAVMTRLGRKYTTFYRHFAGIDELRAAVVDDILAGIDVRPVAAGADDWARHLDATARSLFDSFEAHPGLALAVLRLPQLPARLNEAYAEMARLMLDAGFAPPDAVLGASMMIELAASPFLDVRPDVTGAQLRRSQAHAALDALPAAVRDATSAAVDGPAGTWVQRKVDLVIEGLAARRTAPRSAPDHS